MLKYLLLPELPIILLTLKKKKQLLKFLLLQKELFYVSLSYLIHKKYLNV